MYYEEKIINGVLMFRNRPDGDWSQCSIEKMGQRIMELEITVHSQRHEIERLGCKLAMSNGKIKTDY